MLNFASSANCTNWVPDGFIMGSDLKLFEVFRKELNALGYVEGKNLIIDKRQAEGRNDRLPALVSELIALHPDVLVTVATAAIAAAQRATSTIPIVMTLRLIRSGPAL